MSGRWRRAAGRRAAPSSSATAAARRQGDGQQSERHGGNVLPRPPTGNSYTRVSKFLAAAGPCSRIGRHASKSSKVLESFPKVYWIQCIAVSVEHAPQPTRSDFSHADEHTNSRAEKFHGAALSVIDCLLTTLCREARLISNFTSPRRLCVERSTKRAELGLEAIQPGLNASFAINDEAGGRPDPSGTLGAVSTQ